MFNLLLGDESLLEHLHSLPSGLVKSTNCLALTDAGAAKVAALRNRLSQKPSAPESGGHCRGVVLAWQQDCISEASTGRVMEQDSLSLLNHVAVLWQTGFPRFKKDRRKATR